MKNTRARCLVHGAGKGPLQMLHILAIRDWMGAYLRPGKFLPYALQKNNRKSMNTALRIANDLTAAVTKLKIANATPNRHIEALKKLSTIFEEKSMTMDHQDKEK